MNPLDNMTPPALPTTALAAQHQDLETRVTQAEATLDNKRRYYERAHRYYTECPVGDRRKANALTRMHRIAREMSDAQTALGQALDRLFDFETEHPEFAPDERWPEVTP